MPHFLIMWPLVLCGHVDGLKKQEDRDKWHNIFVGDAAEKLGRMVQFWGWEEFGYPLEWPNGTSAPPRLRISSHTEADMAKVKKQMFQFQKDAHNNVLQLMKVDGRYTIGSVFFQPDVANQLYLTRTLISHEEEENAEGLMRVQQDHQRLQDDYYMARGQSEDLPRLRHNR